MPDGTAALQSLTRPVTILVGHSGSGKSEVAVNLALAYRGLGRTAVLVDLDLVKPYFRSRLTRDSLAAAGVEVVVPGGDRLYADIPIVPPEVRGYLGLEGRQSSGPDAPAIIVDVGGNDSGARVLGSLSNVIDPKKTELLFVVNANRPLTGDVDAMTEMIGFVSRAASLEVTGLVSNTHLMDETTQEIVREGLEATRSLSERTGIPVRFFCVPEFDNQPSIIAEDYPTDCPVLVLRRHILPPHTRPAGSGRAGVL